MSMISKVKKIGELLVAKIPAGRGVECARIAVDGNRIVVLLKNGRIWTNWDSFRKYCLQPHHYGADSFLRCLVALGLITTDDRKKHQDHAAECQRDARVRDHQGTLNRLARMYGFKAPKLKRGAIKP